MIDDKSSLIDKIGYYVENPEDENTLKNIFSQEERSLLDAVRELELVKAAAPEEKPENVNEEVEMFLAGVDRDKEASLRLKERVLHQMDILLGRGEPAAWLEIMTWYQVLQRKGLLVNVYWEFPILKNMIKIFKEEMQDVSNKEIYVLAIHNMKELTEIYFRMVFMIRRMAYGVNAADDILDYLTGRQIFPVFLKVLGEDNHIEIPDKENILEGLSGWGGRKNDNG